MRPILKTKPSLAKACSYPSNSLSKRYWTLITLAVLAELPCGAQPETPFVLAEAEVIKSKWETRALRAADLDADGREDLALINNEDARIDLFYQLAPGEKPGESERKTTPGRWDPVFDGARFERIKVLTGSLCNDLAIGDLNHDGRLDLVYTNDRDELVIHFQGDKSDWSEKRYIELDNLAGWADSLWIGKLDANEKNDLIVLCPDEVKIFPDGNVDDSPVVYALVFDNPRGLTVCDLDRDGRQDIVYYYLVSGDESSMAARFQREDGRFVSEHFYDFEQVGSFPKLLNWQKEKAHDFVAVSNENNTLLKVTAGPAATERDEDEETTLARSAYAVPAQGDGESFYAVADFTGDKRLDVVASDGDGAQVWLFQQSEHETFLAPESFPAFSEINGLAAGDMDGDGRAELIIMSTKEGVVGVSHFSKAQRFEYPSVIPLESVPQVMTAGDVDGDGLVEIVCAVESESNRSYKLQLAEADQTNGGFVARSLTEDEIASRVQGLRVVDINQDGDADVLALSQVQALEVILRQADGNFSKPATNVAGLADKVAPSAITEADLDGDGKAELLITREAFTRSGKIGSLGRAEVTDQINAPGDSANLLVSIAADIDGDQQAELLLVDGNDGEIHVMKRDEKAVYRFAKTHPGVLEVSDSFIGDADNDGLSDLFLFGKGHFWWYPLKPASFEVKAEQLYETDLQDMTYTSLIAGALDDDARDDVVVFDNQSSRIMEVLVSGQSSDSSRVLRSALHFKIFDVDPHFRGQRGSRYQPHDALLADLNADGRRDIAILIHDRLIIYPQQ